MSSSHWAWSALFSSGSHNQSDSDSGQAPWLNRLNPSPSSTSILYKCQFTSLLLIFSSSCLWTAWESSGCKCKFLGYDIHERDLEEHSGSSHKLSTALAKWVIQGVNPSMENLFLSISLCKFIFQLKIKPSLGKKKIDLHTLWSILLCFYQLNLSFFFRLIDFYLKGRIIEP